ncbi:MAG: oxidoreductase [Deltaproteobacteria bacterium]|nr:MAG: oxidoreductase [Deltaproteobacteria bacterium]
MNAGFLPMPARIVAIEPLDRDHRLFSLRPAQPFDLRPGQFVEITIPGVGAFPVSACAPVAAGLLTSCIRRAGRVTEALFQLESGALLGVRGPFGNGFPVETFYGSDPLLIAGGLGIAPLRALLHALLAIPERVGRITLLYGTREPGALLFREELAGLAATGRIDLRLSVDFAEELSLEEWGVACEVGLVNDLLRAVTFDPARTVAALCGPPGLYRCLIEELARAGIPPQRIFATLERRMRCGIGECCHCVTGGVFLCREGPVFSLDRLRSMEGAI